MSQTMSPIVSLVPLITMLLPFFVLNFIVAKRKGENPVVMSLISFVPVLDMIISFYLISITDKAVYDKIDELMSKLDK